MSELRIFNKKLCKKCIPLDNKPLIVSGRADECEHEVLSRKVATAIVEALKKGELNHD